MELQQVIENRHSIRSFKSTNVSDEDVLALIEAARLAPSAKNRQPWKFFIANPEIKNEIVKFMKQWHEENKNEKTSVFETAVSISQAPVLILVFKNSEAIWERSDTLSIGAAIEHMLLKATELKLGSLWIADTYYVKDKISQLIGTNLELFSAVSIGYTEGTPYICKKKTLEEILLNKSV